MLFFFLFCMGTFKRGVFKLYFYFGRQLNMKSSWIDDQMTNRWTFFFSFGFFTILSLISVKFLYNFPPLFMIVNWSILQKLLQLHVMVLSKLAFTYKSRTEKRNRKIYQTFTYTTVSNWSIWRLKCNNIYEDRATRHRERNVTKC